MQWNSRGLSRGISVESGSTPLRCTAERTRWLVAGLISRYARMRALVGSSTTSATNTKWAISSVVECFLDMEEVVGSNPASPTTTPVSWPSSHLVMTSVLQAEIGGFNSHGGYQISVDITQANHYAVTPLIGIYMRLLLGMTCLLLASPAVANTSGGVTIGGTIADHGTSSESTNLDVVSLHGSWEDLYDFNNTIQLSHGKTSLNLISGEAKKLYNFKRHHFYVIGDVRYDYNQFRPWQHTGVVAVGAGYRIIHTDTFKLSNELTGGARATDFGIYPVIRESLWARYETKRVYLYTKLLVERSNITYYREQSGINYNVTPKLTFGIQNLYTRDVKENDITTFNLGVHF